MVKVAILGMGLMGKPMVMNLTGNGVTVMAYNRSPDKLESLKAENIPVTSNASEAIEFADCIISKNYFLDSPIVT